MTQLVITRGIPASGKTTWARAWVAEDETGRARVNRDDLRQTLYGRDAPLPRGLEENLTVTQRAAVAALLRAGTSVVVDDMHLNLRYVTPWRDLADEHDAEFLIQTVETGLAECLRRDEARGAAGGRRVGEAFIKEALGRLRSSALSELPPRPKPYVYFAHPSRPSAYVFDVDGTLALMDGRGPFEWHRVGEDGLNIPVALLASTLEDCGYKIVVMSGRDAVCRPETEAWLKSRGIPYDVLIMRPAGDQRKDSIVKLELFQEHVAPAYAVHGVFDDRDQVVAMWRRIGLPCFQVAPGAF
jgi:predicted kinase